MSTIFQVINNFIQAQNVSVFHWISFVLFILITISFSFKMTKKNRDTLTENDCALFILLLLLCPFLPLLVEMVISVISHY